jgi:ketosteroid isomerase-like protein
MTQAVREANEDTVRRFLEAINRWDFDTMGELLADDLIFELPFAPPGLVRRIDGGSTFIGFVRRVPEVFDEERLQEFRIESYASDPNELVAEYRSDMNVVATGGKYRNTYVSRFTIRDGKIARFAEYCDPVPLLEALGGRVEFDGSAAI